MVPCSVPCARDQLKRQSRLGSKNIARLSRPQPEHRKGSDIASVTDISEAKQRRARICEVADWVVEKVPWTIAVSDWPGFSEQWPALTAADLADIEHELHRRGEALCANDPDLDAITGTLAGHPERWTAAADWLSRHVGRDMTDADFCRLFGKLSRGELILAAIEHRRRLLSGGAV